MVESRAVSAETLKQDCCKSMSRSEKVLLCFLIVSVVISLILFIYIITLLLNGDKICNSRNCIKASAKLLETIDFNYDPCTDFYKFVCGNYITTYQNYEDEIELRKAAIVSAPIEDGESASLVMVKKFYQACTNVDGIQKDSDSTLLSLLEDIGGWPLLLGQQWKEEQFNWTYFMTILRSKGIRSDWLISFDYFVDHDGTNLLLLGPPNLKPIPKELKLIYYDSIVKTAIKFGSSVQIASEELQKVTDFENELAHISARARSKPADANLTVGTLNTIWPQIKLVEILNNLARGYAVFTDKTEVVIVENYIYEMNKLLMQTPKRTRANYLVWKVIESFLPFSSDNIRESYEKYDQIGSREDHCFNEASKRFHGAIEMSYLSRYMNEKMTKSLKTITNSIRHQVIEGDTEVIIMGLEGENSGITEFKFDSDNIIRIITQIHSRIEDKFYTCLHENSAACSRENYYHDTEETATSFDVGRNTIFLPFEILHSDSYKWDQPNYINYGRIGRIIGDAITAELQETNSSLIETHFFGVDLAYQGYLEWVRDFGLEKRLPGLNYTAKQLFWMESCLNYCSVENDTVKFDEVIDSRYFRHDFECQ